MFRCLANREAAFAWAITAAGVTAGVARDCRLNELKNCGCKTGYNPLSVETAGEHVEWEGCSDDVSMGNKHANNYMMASLKGKGNKQALAMHNADVGRRV